MKFDFRIDNFHSKQTVLILGDINYKHYILIKAVKMVNQSFRKKCDERLLFFCTDHNNEKIVNVIINTITLL